MSHLEDQYVELTLRPPSQVDLRLGEQTFPLTIPQFEELFRGAVAATARIFHAHNEEHGTRIGIGETLSVIQATKLSADSDLGTVNIITRIDVGPLHLRFVGPVELSVDYCQQVMSLLTAEQIRGSEPKQ